MRDSLTFIRVSAAKLWIGRDLVTEYRQGPPDWLLLCFTDTETATYVPDEEEAAVRSFPKGHWEISKSNAWQPASGLCETD